MNRLATICARSGSKGLKNKNKLELFGVPLYKRAILQAVDCGYFDFIAVSSDDIEILENALSVGADLAVLRPAELSTDLASKPQTIRHATLQAELAFGSVFDIVADLDVTSPLRLNSDIGGTLQVLESGKHSSVVTVSECHRNPYFNLIEKFENRTFAPAKKTNTEFLARQLAPSCYDMNAAVHAWDRNSLVNDPKVFYANTSIFIMPEIRSRDIDTEIDFKIVELLFRISRDLNFY